jgi:hypothetical protein
MKLNKRKWLRILAIIVIGSFNPEVISTSTPLLEYFSLASLIFMIMYYGLQLIIIEDLVVRFGLGYGAIFLLGLIHGVLEEGFYCKTFFYPAIEFPAYGRVVGINVVWAVWITLLHALITVILTFAIVDTIIPRKTDRPVLSKKGYTFVIAYLVICYVLLFFLFGMEPGMEGFGYVEPAAAAITLAALFALVGTFVWWVRRGKGEKKPAEKRKELSGWYYAIPVAIFTLLILYAPFVFWELDISWIVALLFLLVVVAAFGGLLRWMIQRDRGFGIKKVATMCIAGLLAYLLIAFPEPVLITNPLGTLGAFIQIVLLGRVMVRKSPEEK